MKFNLDAEAILRTIIFDGVCSARSTEQLVDSIMESFSKSGTDWIFSERAKDWGVPRALSRDELEKMLSRVRKR